MRGPGSLDVGHGRVQQVDNGALTISFSDLPYTATPDRSNGFDFVNLKIPLDDELLIGGSARDLVAAVAQPGTAYVRPLTAMFDAITGSSSLAPADDIAHLARLAMLVRGRLPSGMPKARAALRAGTLHAARAILRRDLHVVDLSPDRVSKEQ